MPLRRIPDSDDHYFLVCHDADGIERAEDGRLLTSAVRDAVAGGGITDVVLMSHGWMGDVPAAIQQYDAWTRVAAARADDLARARARRPGFRPLVVGLHWPSLPWGEEAIANADASFDPGDGLRRIVDHYAGVLGDSPATRAALATILRAAVDDPAPNMLPPPVVAAYEALDAAAGTAARGAAAAPGSDREPIDAQEAYAAAVLEGPDAFGAGGFGAVLAPLRMLSFWKMKDRARAFGESGAHRLAASLQAAAVEAGRDVRFHAMGHSFGCIVVSAMIAGTPASRLGAPFASAFLVQGALSLWAYCADIPFAPGTAGCFHALVADGMVSGPVVTTRSPADRAVGRMYPIAAGLAGQVVMAGGLPKYGGLGTFGIQGPGVALVNEPMRPADDAYDFRPRTVHNLDAAAYVKDGDGPSGAHSDIVKAEVAHAMWSTMLA